MLFLINIYLSPEVFIEVLFRCMHIIAVDCSFEVLSENKLKIEGTADQFGSNQDHREYED